MKQGRRNPRPINKQQLHLFGYENGVSFSFSLYVLDGFVVSLFKFLVAEVTRLFFVAQK